MDLLPQFFPPFLPDLLSQKGAVLGLDQIKFEDFYMKQGAPQLAMALTPFWKDQDFKDLDAWCSKIECEAEDLLLVFTSESRLRTDAMNPKTGMPLACGLNQMTRIAFQAIDKLPKDDAKAKGLFPALAYATVKMLVKEQMEQIAIPYFAKCREGMSGGWTAARLYMANASPSLLSKPADPATVIYGKGTEEYGKNAQLDTNGDGQVTMQDLINAVEYHKDTPEYVAAKYRYRKINNMWPFVNPALPPASAWSLA